DDTALTSLNSDDNYEGYVYIAETGALKFAQGSWDTNWGDSDGDGVLEPGGDDITLEPGFYRIQVNLNDLTYAITETSWGLIGDATPGGWDADTDMTYNADENAWELSVDLLGGLDIKFRANDAWDVNLGDTGSDALLEYEGDNIKIPGNGNYTVKLYLGKQDYTYSIESNNSDARKMFFTENQELEITDVSQFNQGYAITKWRNKDRAGNDGKDLTFPDTDFPMFRLADAYLMYAEAHLRGGGGDQGTAIEYVNIVRNRAGAGTITGDDLTLDFLLDERARELYWECHRRTDLVRFGQFTDGTYHWPLKGNSLEGTAVAGFRDIFPIPASDLSANPRLSQNPGY
ncbi:MAG: RagB/SusD family nutrient uptake outer membrane protein, partial [Bacteroidota bacterium]